MLNVKRLKTQAKKHEALRNGRKQFDQLIRPTNYIFVNNVFMPVVNK